MNDIEIKKTLKKIETEENVEILYACEAGSRVWGFANDKSDYDVRFIYKKHEIKDYLSLKEPRDIIEYNSGDLDIVGWDIKKALKLHYNDNPSLREWFLSDHIYIDCGIDSVFSGLGGFNIDVLKNHYASIAKKNWKKYCSLDFKHEKTKKYLYVIRAILCWKLLNRDIFPPINIHELLNHDFINIDMHVKSAIEDLVDYHQGGGLLSEDTFLKFNNFIIDSLSVMETSSVHSFKDFDDYDERFRELLLVFGE